MQKGVLERLLDSNKHTELCLYANLLWPGNFLCSHPKLLYYCLLILRQEYFCALNSNSNSIQHLCESHLPNCLVSAGKKVYWDFLACEICEKQAKGNDLLDWGWKLAYKHPSLELEGIKERKRILENNIQDLPWFRVSKHSCLNLYNGQRSLEYLLLQNEIWGLPNTLYPRHENILHLCLGQENTLYPGCKSVELQFYAETTKGQSIWTFRPCNRCCRVPNHVYFIMPDWTPHLMSFRVSSSLLLLRRFWLIEKHNLHWVLKIFPVEKCNLRIAILLYMSFRSIQVQLN